MPTAANTTVQKVGETEDSGMSVFEARLGQSYMNFSFDTVEPTVDLRVYNVYSAQKGDMKRLLDHVCGRYDCTTVRFVNVISDRLRDRLGGFEEHTEMVPEDHPSGMAGEEYDVLQGEWVVE